VLGKTIELPPRAHRDGSRLPLAGLTRPEHPVQPSQWQDNGSRTADPFDPPGALRASTVRLGSGKGYFFSKIQDFLNLKI